MPIPTVSAQCVAGLRVERRDPGRGTMSLNVLDQKLLNQLPQLSDVNSTYGVRLNALSVDDLFALYQRTGFLNDAKGKRLLPYIDLVRDNWR